VAVVPEPPTTEAPALPGLLLVVTVRLGTTLVVVPFVVPLTAVTVGMGPVAVPLAATKKSQRISELSEKKIREGWNRGEGGGDIRQIKDERPVAAAMSAVAVQAVATQAPIDSRLVGTQKQARSATPAVQTGVAQLSAQVGMLCALTTEAARANAANERYFISEVFLERLAKT